MRYALIGCGMISASHIKAALETGLEIAALCDLSEENCRKAQSQLPEGQRDSVRLYTDYRQMLSEIILSWRRWLWAAASSAPSCATAWRPAPM